jgi:adenosine deaminase
VSVESYIRAMPKVELHLHLEGALRTDTLLTIAEQNEIAENLKHFDEWVRLLHAPDYQRLGEIVQTTNGWLRQPDDLTRVVYDLGVALRDQNVRYAEVSVDPVLYTDNGISFEQFMSAIEDGRSRAERAWGVRMAWIFTIPREQPRRSDDVVRWATTPANRKSGVVALGLSGREEVQPVGQFERAFHAAEKKLLPRTVHAGDAQVAEGILEAIHTLIPDRIYDGWGAADAPDVLSLLVERDISLNIALAKALVTGKVATYADYPLRHLYDEGVALTIGSDMPSFYKSTLTDEYIAVVEHLDFSLDELEELALNAIRTSFLDPEEKQNMLAAFTEEYEQLRAQHITPEQTT